MGTAVPRLWVKRAQVASAELSRRVEKVAAYPPLSEMGDLQRREFHKALLDAESFEDLPASGRRRS